MVNGNWKLVICNHQLLVTSYLAVFYTSHSHSFIIPSLITNFQLQITIYWLLYGYLKYTTLMFVSEVDCFAVVAHKNTINSVHSFSWEFRF